MNILVLLKQVPDAAEVVIDPVTHTLLRSGVEAVMNPFDVHALEEALRFKEKHGGTVTAVTMGPQQAEKTLREAIAMGADDAVLLTDRAFAGSDSWATARVLAAYCVKEKYDLILCGKQAVDGDTAQVPSELAAVLDIPQATQVRALSFDGTLLRAEQSFDEYVVTVEMRLPAVVSLVREINEPRFPTLAGYVRALEFRVRHFTATDLGLDPATVGLAGSPTRVVCTHTVAFAEKARQMFTSVSDESLREVVSCISAARAVRHESVTVSTSAQRYLQTVDLSAMRGWFVVVAQDHAGVDDDAVRGLVAALSPFAERRGVKVAVMTWGEGLGYVASGADGIIRLKTAAALSLEARAEVIAGVAKNGSFEVICMSAHGCGRALAPRTAALLATGLTADCTAFDMDETGNLLQIRPAFGGNLEATIACPHVRPQMATVRPGVFTGRRESRGVCLTVDVAAEISDDRGARIVERVTIPHGDHDLADARIVFSGGRGAGGSAGFSLLAELAGKVGGSVAASRGAVDLHLAPYMRQVGQTGRTISPDLYIACGISGNIQHIAGMRNAKTVIAINKDPKAAIFSLADIGIVADVKDVLSRLLEMV